MTITTSTTLPYQPSTSPFMNPYTGILNNSTQDSFWLITWKAKECSKAPNLRDFLASSHASNKNSSTQGITHFFSSLGAGVTNALWATFKAVDRQFNFFPGAEASFVETTKNPSPPQDLERVPSALVPSSVFQSEKRNHQCLTPQSDRVEYVDALSHWVSRLTNFHSQSLYFVKDLLWIDLYVYRILNSLQFTQTEELEIRGKPVKIYLPKWHEHGITRAEIFFDGTFVPNLHLQAQLQTRAVPNPIESPLANKINYIVDWLKMDREKECSNPSSTTEIEWTIEREKNQKECSELILDSLLKIELFEQQTLNSIYRTIEAINKIHGHHFTFQIVETTENAS